MFYRFDFMKSLFFVAIQIFCFVLLFRTQPTLAHIEEVEVVAARENQIGQGVSASSGVVGGDEIQLRALQRTGSVLELVPGMVVTQHSGTGKANQYFLRGFNLDHGTDFATSIDGMPINMRSHGHGQGYTDLNFIIPEAIEKVAYKKGAYYAEVGDFSGAGSAEFFTRSRFDNSGADSGSAGLEAGEDDYYRALVLADFSALNGQWFIATEHHKNQGPWTDISEDLNKHNLLMKHQRNWRGGELDFALMAYDNHWNSADQIPQRAVNTGLIDEFGSIDTTVGGEASRYSLSAQWRTPHWQAGLYAIRSDLNLWSNFTYFLEDNVNGDQFEQVDSRVIYGGTLRHEKHLQLFNRPVTLRLGSELRYDRIRDVGLFSSRDRLRLGAIRRDSINEASVGSYSEASMAISDQLKAVVAVRYDYFDFEVDDKAGVNINGRDLSVNGGDENDDKWSFKAGLIHNINSEWELYGSLGQGFHSNDARGTTIRIDPDSGDAVGRVDPLVASFGYELGLRGFISDRINLSLAAWELELDSELLFVGDAGNTEASGASEREGIELTVYYRLSESLTADLEYAYADSQFKNTEPGVGDDIPGAISEVVQAGLSVDMSSGWFGSLRLRYFGDRPLEDTGRVRSDSSTVVNLRAGYKYEQWLFKLDVLNLLDSDDHDIDYFYESRLASEPAGVEDIHYHILEPRTVRLGVEYTF